MRIAVIGKGRLGSILGPAFVRAGHDVRYGLRVPDDPKHDSGDNIARLGTRAAVDEAEVIVLAVDWPAIDQALADCGPMAGKVLLDCTNPLDYHPERGITLAFGFDRSGGEYVAGRTEARSVKTLNHVSAAAIASARDFPVHPIQFVAGDDASAKETVSGLLRDMGFSPVDYGGIANSRKLEPLGAIMIDQYFVHGLALDTGLAFVGPEGPRA